MDLSHIPGILLLIFGFGFVIFWHELGHFIAAKWAGVKVEQFAVGFGQALVSFRKGLGWTFGSSREKYEQMLAAEQEGIQKVDLSKIGETEYRLNWIPLGGYVKMLGQDDLRPNAEQTDPGAYNMKSIGKRMVIVSAGVIMNVILAIIGFTVLFGYGFRANAPVVGMVAPNSPAQHAGIQVGDTIVAIDGKWQADFTKIMLSVALAGEKESVPVVVKHPDGKDETLMVTAERRANESKGFLALGIGGSFELRGLDPAKVEKDDTFDPDLNLPSFNAVHPGDTIVAINGEKVTNPGTEYYKLDRAAQASFGKPIVLSIQSADGKPRDEKVAVTAMPAFGDTPLNFLGMEPRAVVEGIAEKSVAVKKLAPGDVVQSMRVASTGDTRSNPTMDDLRERLNLAGHAEQAVVFTVLRDGKQVPVPALLPAMNVDKEKDRRGLGIIPGPDMNSAVIGGVIKGSPAETAGIATDDRTPDGAAVTAVDGQPVQSWFDVHRLLKQHIADKSAGAVKVTVRNSTGEKTFEFPIDAAQATAVNSILYSVPLVLREETTNRRTSNPIEAAKWGVGETRDLIVQFYLTIRRMAQGSVSPSNAMGPLGIVTAGAHFADKGYDWLIWFLSMISANLAVVNFLPIPIVDGGLFTFLIIEKLQGRPISARTQSIAQVVGLALIASVFLFVTYHDILRMF